MIGGESGRDQVRMVRSVRRKDSDTVQLRRRQRHGGAGWQESDREKELQRELEPLRSTESVRVVDAVAKRSLLRSLRPRMRRAAKETTAVASLGRGLSNAPLHVRHTPSRPRLQFAHATPTLDRGGLRRRPAADARNRIQRVHTELHLQRLIILVTSGVRN